MTASTKSELVRDMVAEVMKKRDVDILEHNRRSFSDVDDARGRTGYCLCK